MNDSWEVILEQNDDGEIILPFPPELIKRYDWLEGDEIDFEIKEGYVIVRNITAKIRENGLG